SDKGCSAKGKRESKGRRSLVGKDNQHGRDQISEREEKEDTRNGGASVEVMFEHCVENFSVAIKARLKETQTGLVGFSGEVTKLLGKIELEVCFGSEGLCRRKTMKFTVIRAPSPYNVILGRTGLRALRAIPSTIHSMMKFYSERNLYFGHQVSDHIRMQAVRKETSGRKRKKGRG
ncbi:hypothetical protein Tco_0595485, partial [Tanacetum coccineum]